jgi:hypothetical protein
MRLALVTAMVMLTAVLVALPVSHFNPQNYLTLGDHAPARAADSSVALVPQPPPAITVKGELVRATVVRSIEPPPPPKAVRVPVQRPVARKPPPPSPQRRSLLARIFFGTGEPHPQPLLRIKLR